MAFPNPPKTWVAAAVLTAAQLNAELRDALNALLPTNIVARTSYTPVITQSGAVTKTVNRARYQRHANDIIVQLHMTCTGSGTGANLVTITTPVTAAYATEPLIIGSGYIYDASTNLLYHGNVFQNSTTTVAMYPMTSTTATGLGVNTFTAALASSDQIAVSFNHEV